MKKQLPSFPFKARINGNVVTVTGMHHTGACFTTQGHGLVPLSVVPLEESLEPGGVRVPWAAVAPKSQKVWKRSGCFRSDPLPRHVVAAKADKARSWLRKTLTEPTPAAEILKLAERAGIPLRGLHRAKRRLGVKSVKRGGKWQGWGAVWLWQFPTA